MEAQNQHQIVDTLALFIGPLITKSNFSTPFSQCAFSPYWNVRWLLVFGKSVIVCILLISSYLMSRVLEIISEKNLKSNEAGIFAQICQDRWIFFLCLKMEQALFYIKNLLSWNTTDLTYYLSYVIAMKNFSIFFYALTDPFLTTRSILLI